VFLPEVKHVSQTRANQAHAVHRDTALAPGD
jgi:hypothetical protein